MLRWRINALFSGILFTFIFVAGLTACEVLAAPGPFPAYKCLEQNVEFWKKVFTQYSSRQDIIHDSYQLSIVYDVIELQNSKKRGARKINKNRIKEAKNYSNFHPEKWIFSSLVDTNKGKMQ